ncbi:MAG: hypothetical protein ACRBBS_11415 [Thalassovita sp.]
MSAAPTLLWAQDELTAAQRSALHVELRAALMADPELVLPAFGDALSFQDAVTADQALLEHLTPVLFAENAWVSGPEQAPAIALITTPECDCADSRDLLLGWAQEGRVRLYEWPLSAPQLDPLGLDLTPSFVFSDMVVRGDVPPVVLEKYLKRR